MRMGIVKRMWIHASASMGWFDLILLPEPTEMVADDPVRLRVQRHGWPTTDPLGSHDYGGSSVDPMLHHEHRDTDNYRDSLRTRLYTPMGAP